MLNQAKRLVSELHASNEVPIIAPVSQPNTDKLLGFCEAMLIFPFILTFFFFSSSSSSQHTRKKGLQRQLPAHLQIFGEISANLCSFLVHEQLFSPKRFAGEKEAEAMTQAWVLSAGLPGDVPRMGTPGVPFRQGFDWGFPTEGPGGGVAHPGQVRMC